MTDDILDRIQSTLDATCGHCQGPIPDTSVSDDFCEEECQHAFHRATARDPNDVDRRPELLAINWDPDLIVSELPTDFQPVAAHEIPTALTPPAMSDRLRATVFRAETRQVWHLRLDDGHRYVGRDVPDETLLADERPEEHVERVWGSLQRQLTDGRYTAPILPQRVRQPRQPSYHYHYQSYDWRGDTTFWRTRVYLDTDGRAHLDGATVHGFGEAVVSRRTSRAAAGQCVYPRTRTCVWCVSETPNERSDCERCTACWLTLPAVTHGIEQDLDSGVVAYRVRIGEEELVRFAWGSPAPVEVIFRILETELIASLHERGQWLIESMLDQRPFRSRIARIV